MSGYLRRLVERHAVEPTARPRARSRFETEVSGIRESAGPVAVPPPIEKEPAAFPNRIEFSPSKATTTTAPLRRHGERHPAPAAPTEPRVSLPAEPSTDHVADQPALERQIPPRPAVAALARSVSLPDRRPEASVPPRIAATVLPRTAPPAPAGERWMRPPDGAAARTAPREPDVVRVQIGRVEVRAVLPPAERPAPRAPSRPADSPLSLERYLAGKGRP